MSETRRYAYHFALIDETGYCYEVRDTTTDYSDIEGYVAIPSYNEDYLEKYYLNGTWYEDAEGTIPWSPEN